MQNLFKDIPQDSATEIMNDLVASKHVRIERILSYGQSSPAEGWYDQEENEWVMVVSGYGVLAFEDGRTVKLEQGDHLNIPPHQKHKVIETSPDTVTVWLAVFYE